LAHEDLLSVNLVVGVVPLLTQTHLAHEDVGHAVAIQVQEAVRVRHRYNIVSRWVQTIWVLSAANHKLGEVNHPVSFRIEGGAKSHLDLLVFGQKKNVRSINDSLRNSQLT
jgi:hypothetical protein